MQKSATVLGKEYGLNGAEMNRVLKKLDFLAGEPGNYSPTEKALEYVVENEHYQGTGGYSWFNPHWTTRKFDDSITEVLDITPELKQQVRDEIAAERLDRSAALALERENANREYLAREAAKKVAEEAEFQAKIDYEEFIENLKKAGWIGLGLAAAAGVGYGIYKVAPHVKSWYKNKFKKDEILEREDITVEKDYETES